MNKLSVKLSYDDRELIIAALDIYSQYLIKPSMKRTYPKSPVASKDAKRLEKKIRKVHFCL